MGLLDGLFGRKEETSVDQVDDTIWKTKADKWKGISEEITKRVQSNSVAVLLVAHFPDVLEHLEELADEYTGEIPVQASLAADLHDGHTSTHHDELTMDIIVAERHPLVSSDERIREFATTATCKCRLAFHLSMEDDLIRLFIPEMAMKVIEHTISDGESIKSRMVSKRIVGAQNKIEAKSTGNAPATSAEQWLKDNYVSG